VLAYQAAKERIENARYNDNDPNGRFVALEILRNAFEVLIDYQTRSVYDALIHNEAEVYEKSNFEILQVEEDEPVPYVEGALREQLKNSKPHFVPESLFTELEKALPNFNKAKLIFNSENDSDDFFTHVKNQRNTLMIMKTKNIDSNPPTHVSFNGVFSDRPWGGPVKTKFSKNIFMFNLKNPDSNNQNVWRIKKRPEEPNRNSGIQTTENEGPGVSNGFSLKRHFQTQRCTNLAYKDYYLPNHQVDDDKLMEELDFDFFEVPFFNVMHMAVWELSYKP